MSLDAWAIRWSIPSAAVLELQAALAEPTQLATVEYPKGSEAAVQQLIRLEASKQGARLWRNNVGVLRDERDIPVRYGLANDSKQMNSKVKSSDLIGITPHLVTPADVGRVLGIFTSIEVKKPGWVFNPAKQGPHGDRERAQLAWLQLIHSLGGRATFATSVEDLQGGRP